MNGDRSAHGTTSRYRARCRCPLCRQAKRAENARRPNKLGGADRARSRWRDATGKRIWTEADNERARAHRPPPRPLLTLEELRARRNARDRAKRRARRRQADGTAAFIADEYRQAVESAEGELAALIAEQAADARSNRVFALELADWHASSEWDDPTAKQALARVA